MLRRIKSDKGFTLIEAVLTMVLIGIAFFSFGFLFGNIEQEALTSDLTILATKLGREKMEMLMQEKAEDGYSSIVDEAAVTVSSGNWDFERSVDTQYVNASDLSDAVINTGYMRVDVTVAWGVDAGESITLTTLMTNVTP